MGLQARAIEAQVSNTEADTALKIAQAAKEAGEASKKPIELKIENAGLNKALMYGGGGASAVSQSQGNSGVNNTHNREKNGKTPNHLKVKEKNYKPLKSPNFRFGFCFNCFFFRLFGFCVDL